jgi:hypothetical protein
LAGHPRVYRVAPEVEKSHISEYVDAEMHAIVSVVGRSGLVAMEALAGSNTAVSPEAYSVRKAAAKIVESIERSALVNKSRPVSQMLSELIRNCIEESRRNQAIMESAALAWHERHVERPVVLTGITRVKI